MTEATPKWAMRIYAKLWSEFNTNKFSREQAKKVVNNENNNLPQALSKLKRDGWLIIEMNPKDSRRSLYSLKDPKKAIEELGKVI